MLFGVCFQVAVGDLVVLGNGMAAREVGFGEKKDSSESGDGGDFALTW